MIIVMWCIIIVIDITIIIIIIIGSSSSIINIIIIPAFRLGLEDVRHRGHEEGPQAEQEAASVVGTCEI